MIQGWPEAEGLRHQSVQCPDGKGIKGVRAKSWLNTNLVHSAVITKPMAVMSLLISEYNFSYTVNSENTGK